MTYEFENNFGKFFVFEHSGKYSVSGSIKAAAAEFKKIGKRPPNKYGNFYGREKAGYEACKILIENRTGDKHV